MKISAVPKSPQKTNNNLAANTNANRVSMNSNRGTSNHSTSRATTKLSSAQNNSYSKMLSKKQQRRDTNSSSCSSSSDSDDDSDSSSVSSKNKRVKRPIKHFNSTSNKTDKNASKSRGSNKANAKNSSDSTSSSDDSSDSDVAENLPKPQQKELLLKKNPGVSTLPSQNLVADGASSSDMELPNALVEAAIQCAESGSDAESTKVEQSNSTQYTSSLLRDFVVKTQMLGSKMTSANHAISLPNHSKKTAPARTAQSDNESVGVKITTLAAKKAEVPETYSVKLKKKRGRPRKQPALNVDVTAATKNSGSPDSGIISTPQSPVPLSNNNVSAKTNNKKSNMTKSENTAAEKTTSDTNERVPRRRKQQPINDEKPAQPEWQRKNEAAMKKRSADTEPRRLDQATAKTNVLNKSTEQSIQSNEKVDPLWRKIDFNKKFRRPSLSGYRSDTNTVCSKILAAQSGYTSDYCNVNRRHHLSGYKSDASCKSRRSGYKSDYSVKAKSCGYRSDCSTKHRRKIRRKRRTKTVSTKPTNQINDQDLLLLAGLSLGQSDESSLDSTDKQPFKSSASTKNAVPRFSTSNMISSFGSVVTNASAMLNSSGKDSLNSLCERITKRVNSTSLDRLSPSNNNPISTITSSIYKDCDISNSVKLDGMKAGMIRRRRSSAVSHCSSHCSTVSRHPFRRRRRKRLKSTADQSSEINLVKLNAQIEQLIQSFTSQCAIIVDKPVRDKEKSSTAAKSSASSKRGKKRKTNLENTETAVNTNTTTKRRSKKAIQTKSPDDHKLPLKKRHYSMTPGEKSESNKFVQTATGKKSVEQIGDAKEKASTETDAEVVGKAVTPKKRHLLQTPVDLNDVIDSTDATSNSTCKDLQETQASVSIPIANVDTPANKNTVQSKKNEIARKKNRLEGLVSKISPTQSNEVKSSSTPKTPTTPKTATVAKIATAPKTASKVGANSSKPATALKSSTSQPPSSACNTQMSIENSLSPKSNLRTPNARSNKVETVIPPGVFEPTIDLELQIPFTEIPIPLAQKAIDVIATTETARIETTPIAASKTTAKLVSKPPKGDGVVEKLLNRTGANVHSLGKKKRKKPNRTGFPTLKKKKKQLTKQVENVLLIDDSTTASSEMSALAATVPNEPDSKNVGAEKPLESTKSKQSCDRVPSEGEATGTFIERNQKPRLSVVSLERLQGKSVLEEKSSNHKNTKSEKAQKPRDIVPTKSLIVEPIAPKKQKIDSKTEDKPNANLPDAKKSGNKATKNQEKTADNKKPNDKVAAKSNITVRQSRSSTNANEKQRHDKVVSTPELLKLSKGSKSTKTQVNEKKSPERRVRTPVVEKPLERSPSKSKPSKGVEAVVSKIDKKRSTPVAPIVEQTKPVKGVKRTINGRIKSPGADLSSMKKSPIAEIDQKADKKSRRDAANDQKASSDKKTKSTKTDSVNGPNMGKKRARDESSEKSQSNDVDSKIPSKKSKLMPTEQKKVIKETITDLKDIIPADEWIDRSNHDVLPENENVFYNEASVESDDNNHKKTHSKTKKKFLVAGLFSNYYKEDVHQSTKSSPDKKSNNVSTEEQLPTGSLLPPPEFDVRQTQEEFCLPYDLWFAHDNGKLPGRNVVQSWIFKKIRTNIYADSVKPNQSSDLPQCSCKPEYECGENCLNRLVYTECVPETCPCGDKCRNTKIQRHIIAPGVERFMTAKKGWGVHTKQLIKKGTYILEYVGEVVTEREFKERMATLYVNDIHHYCLHLDGGLVIDGHRMGSDCRFVNHSCEPNCEMQKWSVNGLSRMALFAMRDIQPGEELGYDYNFSLFNPAEGQVCLCESTHCRGVIGGKSQRVRPIESKVS